MSGCDSVTESRNGGPQVLNEYLVGLPFACNLGVATDAMAG